MPRSGATQPRSSEAATLLGLGERNTLFLLKDPQTVVPFLRADTKGAALTTTSLGHASETCASTSKPATGAMGLIPGASASHIPNTKSKRVIQKKTRTKRTLSPVTLIHTSGNIWCPFLPQ